MTSHIEGFQTVLRLSRKKDVLTQLRKNGALRKNKESGEEVMTLQFNSQTFDFSPDIQITVGKSIADALIRSSAVIVGDQLTGEIVPSIEAVTTYAAGRGLAQNTCPYCGEVKETPQSLGQHLLQFCPELKTQKTAPSKKIYLTDKDIAKIRGEKDGDEDSKDETSED